MNELADRVLRLRQERGLTLREAERLTGVRELLTVAKGRLHLVLDDERHELAESDAISFRGDRDHRFDNPSPTEPAMFYVVVMNR